jgi:hypothetical protein
VAAFSSAALLAGGHEVEESLFASKQEGFFVTSFLRMTASGFV